MQLISLFSKQQCHVFFPIRHCSATILVLFLRRLTFDGLGNNQMTYQSKETIWEFRLSCYLLQFQMPFNSMSNNFIGERSKPCLVHSGHRLNNSKLENLHSNHVSVLYKPKWSLISVKWECDQDTQRMNLQRHIWHSGKVENMNISSFVFLSIRFALQTKQIEWNYINAIIDSMKPLRQYLCDNK